MNKFALGMIVGVVGLVGVMAVKVARVSLRHEEAVIQFDKAFTALKHKRAINKITLEEAIAEYELIHAKAVDSCMEHTLDGKKTHKWLKRMHGLNIAILTNI
ncbi:hypothetical protein MZD04_gp117 [Pseudomonas phage Psa21]|uniref:Uncharacterized protein n=1 Tax=Pseudomonas phage Psa21 TaxID=2530023 RepID=A0A481W579_9CAUD|nr:hypothetical protein MZD04_gp117 [Pseudomonas phage Psa21]QBJ02645.1 hypothetical protein PSA21_117 [Pseudomonas phage Psa21]